MVIKKPDMQSAARLNGVIGSHEDFIANYRLSEHKPLGLDCCDSGNYRQIKLLPTVTIDREQAYVIWIKGRVHYLPVLGKSHSNFWRIDTSAFENTGKFGWDATQKIGYRVDGTTDTDSERLLLWAFANEANTQIDGFACTKYPQSAYTGVSGGTKGAQGSFTGLTNARSFTEGSTVIVRNTNGSAGGYEWNYGVIDTISSNTAMTINLWPTMDLANTNITSTTNAQIIQLDRFFPWNGRTDTSDQDDRIFRPNYRLIGEAQTHVLASSISWLNFVRTATTPMTKRPPGVNNNNFLVLSITRTTAGGTAANLPWGRYTAPWATSVDFLIQWTRGSWTDYSFNYQAYFYNLYESIYYSANGTATQNNISLHHKFYQNRQTLMTVTTGTGSGSANMRIYLFGYEDGGLREL